MSKCLDVGVKFRLFPRAMKIQFCGSRDGDRSVHPQKVRDWVMIDMALARQLRDWLNENVD
jgi:hypothetical protein